MDGEQPVDQSPIFLGPPVDARGVIRKRPLPIGHAESLRAMAADFTFFTPAALYLHGKFGDAPLIDYMAELGEDVPLYYHRFDRPVFAGLETASGDADWNHVLWAVRREYWRSLLDFICSLTIAVCAERSTYRYGQQLFAIVDPIAADRSPIVHVRAERALVSTFGIYSNRYLAAFQPGPGLGPPRLRFADPDPADRAAARAYFAGKNPLDAREHHQRRAD